MTLLPYKLNSVMRGIVSYASHNIALRGRSTD